MSVLLRPAGDEISQIYGDYYNSNELSKLKEGNRAEALCSDGLNYHVEIKRIEPRKDEIHLHFLHWNKQLDYRGSLKLLYLAPLGTYSAGISTHNTYPSLQDSEDGKDNKDKILSKRSRAQKSTAFVETSSDKYSNRYISSVKYPDDFLNKPRVSYGNKRSKPNENEDNDKTPTRSRAVFVKLESVVSEKNGKKVVRKGTKETDSDNENNGSKHEENNTHHNNSPHHNEVSSEGEGSWNLKNLNHRLFTILPTAMDIENNNNDNNNNNSKNINNIITDDNHTDANSDNSNSDDDDREGELNDNYDMDNVHDYIHISNRIEEKGSNNSNDMSTLNRDNADHISNTSNYSIHDESNMIPNMDVLLDCQWTHIEDLIRYSNCVSYPSRGSSTNSRDSVTITNRIVKLLNLLQQQQQHTQLLPEQTNNCLSKNKVESLLKLLLQKQEIEEAILQLIS